MKWKQEYKFLGAILALLAASMVWPVISSVAKSIIGRGVMRSGKGVTRAGKVCNNMNHIDKNI